MTANEYTWQLRQLRSQSHYIFRVQFCALPGLLVWHVWQYRYELVQVLYLYRAVDLLAIVRTFPTCFRKYFATHLSVCYSRGKLHNVLQ